MNIDWIVKSDFLILISDHILSTVGIIRIFREDWVLHKVRPDKGRQRYCLFSKKILTWQRITNFSIFYSVLSFFNHTFTIINLHFLLPSFYYWKKLLQEFLMPFRTFFQMTVYIEKLCVHSSVKKCEIV